MSNRISGPDAGLPPPRELYPSSIQAQGSPFVNPGKTNLVSLAAGQAQVIPAGEWWITLGRTSIYQVLDPITNSWTVPPEAPWAGERLYVRSDGVNHRVANLTNVPVTAVVTNGGSDYVQSSTTVTITGSNSEWRAIVGGLIDTSVTVDVDGAGYGQAPMVYVPAPPTYASNDVGGVQATAIATIGSGTVSGITVVNQGAGYQGTSITLSILPNPYDPAFLNGTITTQATALAGVTGDGSITALICENNGTALAGGTTINIAGDGTSAAATAVIMQTVTGTSISVAGAGYGAAPMLQSSAGRTAASATWTNPRHEMTNFIPRPVRAAIGLSGTAIDSVTIDDPGLFTGTPNSLVLAQDDPTTIGVVALTLGGATDTVKMQEV